MSGNVANVGLLRCVIAVVGGGRASFFVARNKETRVNKDQMIKQENYVKTKNEPGNVITKK